MSINQVQLGKPYDSEEYFPLNENYYDILSDCKSLLSENQMETIRIIFKEIVDINSIKRQIFINGIIDMSNKILYTQFLDAFFDYISELNSFINLPLIFQDKENNSSNKNIFDKVYYVTSTKRQNIYDINGNIIYFEDLLAQKEFEQKLKLLIFWKNEKDIEENMNQYLSLAKNYKSLMNFIFISNIENFIQKKKFLEENNYYRVLDDNIGRIKDNIYYIFDDKFLINKYHVIKYPWFVILSKDNNIFTSGVLRLENIQNKIDNFTGNNPESKQNISNLFWIDLSNKIKLNLVRKINLELSNNHYKNIHFYIETNSSIASNDLLSSFDIDAYFFGKLEDPNIEEFKQFAERICEKEKIKNIFYNIKI
jgi:hypothetical protein